MIFARTLLCCLLFASNICAQDDPSDIDGEFALPVQTPEELQEQALRNQRVDQVVRYAHTKYSCVVDYALLASVELGLSEDQKKRLGNVVTRDPVQLMVQKLGFTTAKEDTDCFYLQEESKYQSSLKKLSKAMRAQEVEERKAVDKILDKRQRPLLRQLQFEHLIDHDPFRAIVALEIEASPKQEEQLIKFMSNPYDSRHKRVRTIVDYLTKEFGAARMAAGLTGKTLGSLNVKAKNPPLTQLCTSVACTLDCVKPNIRAMLRLAINAVNCLRKMLKGFDLEHRRSMRSVSFKRSPPKEARNAHLIRDENADRY